MIFLDWGEDRVITARTWDRVVRNIRRIGWGEITRSQIWGEIVGGKWGDHELAISLFMSARRERSIVAGYRAARMRDRILDLWRRGERMVRIADILDVQPTAVARVVDGGARYESELAEVAEADIDTKAGIQARARLALYRERVFVRWLRELGLSLQTEDDIGEAQIAEYGRAVATPDVLFTSEVYYGGQRIFWIEYKDYTGVPGKMYAKVYDQVSHYVRRWGAGILCYYGGYVSGVLKVCDGVILKDAGTLPCQWNYDEENIDAETNTE